MDSIRLIPKPGLAVIDPADHRPLPPEGKAVRGNQSYWRRRLRDGDVTAAPPSG